MTTYTLINPDTRAVLAAGLTLSRVCALQWDSSTDYWWGMQLRRNGEWVLSAVRQEFARRAAPGGVVSGIEARRGVVRSGRPA